MSKKLTNDLLFEAEKQLQKLRRQIDYDTKDFTIELLINKFKKNEFFIPEYQRNFIWKQDNKSLFIESVLLGLPIPFMFFADTKNGNQEIIDGAQRIQTLAAFLSDQLKLSKLPKLTKLEGFKFSNLSSPTQKRFLNTTLRIVILDEKTTDDIRQDLFNRINTSGIRATDSEIRRGAYKGKFTKFIEHCCENLMFKKLCPISNNKLQHREDFELILRYFAYLTSYKSQGKDVKSFLNHFLQQNIDTDKLKEYEQDFEKMLSFVDKYFKYGFAKSQKATSTPRVRFEALSVGVSLALKIKPSLIVTNIDWIQSQEFKELTTADASNNSGRLAKRIEFVRDNLLKSSQC